MIHIKSFSFNPFQENTFVLYDETKEAIIFDPGCYTGGERKQLEFFIKQNELKPVKLINTHCHLDHVFGNKFVAETYNLELEIHKLEIPVLNSFMKVCQNYGIPNVEPSPAPSHFIEHGDEITFGNSSLKAILTPGHSPGSLSFFSEKERFVIAGDVLFHGSIGRADLPGGDYYTLISSIMKQLIPLGDDVNVYCGHGPATTIGYERLHNEYLN